MTRSVSHSVQVCRGDAVHLVNADEQAVADVRFALTCGLGGSAAAELFIANSHIDVLLARHFTEHARSWAYAEAFNPDAYPIAQQALGSVAAYFDAGHTGKNLFMSGLPALDTDELGSGSHIYFSQGARLLSALTLRTLRHCLPQ